ncbi:lipopolysaccharide biosynthesis protein [Phenylobacterium sp.]|uniref:lipopolysaccharide biosynthesis protein n=1 Tax=Phenylobacterium sp. TaxID=1871053 RepID=UPI002F3F3509
MSDAVTSPGDSQVDRKAIFRGAGLAMTGFLIRPLSRVPFLLIVGRIYGESQYGRYVFALGLFEALAAFCRLGLKDNLFRFLSEYPQSERQVLAEALAIGVSLSAIGAVLVAAVAPAVGDALHAAPMWRMLGVLVRILPVFVAADLLFAATRFQRAVGYEVVGRSIVEPLMVTAGAFAFGMAGFGAEGLLIGYMAAQAATLALAAVGVARRFPRSDAPFRFDAARMRTMAARSLPTGFADCVGLGFNAVGVLLIGNLIGEAALGVYGMALNLETALSKVRQAFDMVVVPIISQGVAAEKRSYVIDQLQMVGRSILTAQLPLLAVCVLFGADLLGLFGKGFQQGAPILALLALAAVIDGVLNLAQVPLFLSRPKSNLAIALVALAVNLGLGALLARRLGLPGVGLGVVVALAVAGTARQLMIRRLFGRSLLTPAFWKPLAATAGAASGAAVILALLPGTPANHGLAAASLVLGYGLLLAAVDRDLRNRALAWARTRLQPKRSA